MALVQVIGKPTGANVLLMPSIHLFSAIWSRVDVVYFYLYICKALICLEPRQKERDNCVLSAARSIAYPIHFLPTPTNWKQFVNCQENMVSQTYFLSTQMMLWLNRATQIVSSLLKVVLTKNQLLHLHMDLILICCNHHRRKLILGSNYMSKLTGIAMSVICPCLWHRSLFSKLIASFIYIISILILIFVSSRTTLTVSHYLAHFTISHT